MTTRTQIGPYKIITVLGKGGMGVVYLGEHEATQERYAVKTLTASSPEVVRSLRREITALRVLDHPHIVRIHEDGITDDGLPWYAMEYLVGVPLDEALRVGISGITRILGPKVATRATAPPTQVAPGERAGRAWTSALSQMSSNFSLDETVGANALMTGTKWSDETMDIAAVQDEARPTPVPVRSFGDIQESLALMAQVTHALAYLHGEGLVHCDLKPQNVVVTREGHAVLVDFGLATTRDAATEITDLEEAGLAAGTALYLAPERIRGQNFDARLDLYALGCMLYEAITGRVAFHRKSFEQILIAHVSADIPSTDDHITDLPPALAELTTGLLQKTPERRPSNAIWAFWQLRMAGVDCPTADLPQVAPHLYSSAFVGRDQLLQRCNRSVKQARDGQTTFLMLAGESGVGKSRLATEVLRRARGYAMEVLVGQCSVIQGAGSTIHRNRALGGFARILETLAQRADTVEKAQAWFGRNASILAPYVSALRRLPGVDGHPEPHPLDWKAAKQRLCDAVASVLRAYLADRRTVLVVEDLQWADEMTLAVLGSLRQKFSDAAWLILGTYRSDETFAELDAFVATDGVECVEVDRLTASVSQWMVFSMLGTEDVPQSLVAFVDRHATGNPYFVVSCVRAAVEGGYLSLDDRGHWQFDAAEGLSGAPMPTTLLDAIHRRLLALPTQGLALVQAASVLGREADLTLLHSIAELDDFEEALRTVVARELLEFVERRGAPQHRFAHDKLVEYAYASLAREPERCRALHTRTADIYATRRESDEDVDLGRLAWHLEHSGRTDEARTTYFEAFREATTRYAHGEAERLLVCGLSLTGEEDAASLSAQNAFVQDVLLVQGRMQEAERWLGELLEKALEEVFPHHRAHVLRSLGRMFLRTGRIDEALTTFEQSRDLSCRLGDREGESFVLNNLGIVHQQQGRYREALACYRDTVEIAGEVGNTRATGSALGNIGVVHHLQGRYEEALAHYNAALEISREIPDKGKEAHLLGNMGLLDVAQGRYGEALSHLGAALEIAREAGDRRKEANNLGQIGHVHEFQGRYREALAHYEAALETAGDLRDKKAIARRLCSIGAIHQRQGRHDEAISMYRQSLILARELGSKRLEADCLAHLATVDQLEGRLQSAADHSDQALGIFRELGDQKNEGITLGRIGIGLQQQGRLAEALQHFHDALQIAEEIGDQRHQGKWLSNLAIVHQIQNRYGQALDHFERALAIHREIGNHEGTGTCLGNMGIVHDEQGRWEEALALFEESLAIARELGYRRLEGIRLGNIGGVHRRRGRYEKALADYEDALAIARELNNPAQIAQKLGNLGSLYREQGHLEKARAHYDEARQIAESVDDKRLLCNHVGSLALIDEAQGRMQRARAGFEEGLAAARELGMRGNAGYWLTYLGRTHRACGELDRAQACQDEALEILEELGIQDALGECLCEQAHLRLHAGEPVDKSVARIQDIAQALAEGPMTDLSRAVARLQRAVQAAERGETLVFGQCLEDFPEPVQKRLTNDEEP